MARQPNGVKQILGAHSTHLPPPTNTASRQLAKEEEPTAIPTARRSSRLPVSTCGGCCVSASSTLPCRSRSRGL